jgi:hypothetical protein
MVLESKLFKVNQANQEPQTQLVQHVQHIMVDNSICYDNSVQLINLDNFDQLEAILPPINQLKLIRGIGYYLNRTDDT